LATGLHGAARTTPRVPAELQAAKESTRTLAARYGLNAKTVAKWRKRASTADPPMGPSRPKSTVLAEIEEAIVVEFRRRTLLPLDDVLGCLRQTIPALSRSALHRCLQRHGISRLPKSDKSEDKRGRFARTTIGYVHIDVCELRWAEGKGAYVPRHRPGLEVRLCRTASRRNHARRRRVLAQCHRSLPLPACIPS
jgi:transposase-like protein